MHPKTVFCHFRLKESANITRDWVSELKAAAVTQISRYTAARRLNEGGLYANKKH